MKRTEKQKIIDKIEQNDPEILGELAEIILATRVKVDYKYKTVKYTDKELKNKNK